MISAKRTGLLSGGRSRKPRVARAVAMLLFVVSANAQAADLVVKYLDVGQGDAIFVKCPDGRHHMLIDSGDSRYPGAQAAFKEAIRKELPPPAPNRQAWLNLVVATHPHSDHIAGLPWVLENFHVQLFVDNGMKADSATWTNLNRLRKKYERDGLLRYIDASQSTTRVVAFCPALKVTLIMIASAHELKDPNDQSVAVRIDYDSASFLFVGDMEEKAEEAWLGAATPEKVRNLADVDVLKVGHHGSETSTTRDFLWKVSPRFAVISCGQPETATNVGYKHPRNKPLQTLKEWFNEQHSRAETIGARLPVYDSRLGDWKRIVRPDNVWVTSIDGTVTVKTDGTSFTWSRSR
jgi:competence protein ComEC